ILQHGKADVKGGAADTLVRQAQLLDRLRDGDAVASTAREHELDVLMPLIPGLDRGERGPLGGTDADLDEIDAGRFEHARGAVHARLLIERARDTDHAADQITLLNVDEKALTH